MRLLNTRSFELQIFVSTSTTPDYVILSHRWFSEECSFEDVTKGFLADPEKPARKKEGFLKLQGTSAELQEAINSMWKYYAEANICYVYMADVEDFEDGEQSFGKSDWFRRGWTLQELIEPVCVEFYANDWGLLGTKGQMSDAIANATGIIEDVLLRKVDVNHISAAQKLSWAAHRIVTREEDEAYSLLRLFNVNMPLLYGEGQTKAFTRLQEAIYLFTGGDQTLFLYRHGPYEHIHPLLADSATRFCNKGTCVLCLLSGLKKVKCLPSKLRYQDIISPVMWQQTQAHETIMTTVTS